MDETRKVIHSGPETLGGIPVFVGTRVPVQNLLDYFEADVGLDRFLEGLRSVSREQTIGALEMAREAWAAGARLPP